MMSSGFSYDENAGMKKTEKFGIEWNCRVNYDMTDGFSEIYMINPEFGEFVISKKALDRINENDYYKVLSLIYEQKLNKNIYSITLAEEKDKLQWKYDNYISLSIDDFFSRFPANFIEIQQRALINWYNQYPEYGQEINSVNIYNLFAKNESELLFILESMRKKGWIDISITKTLGGSILSGFPSIADEGWMEIERIVKKKRKRQIFIAMKFKDMDSVYNSINQAIIDASFIPLRIDKKEHINQISSEIQYEISQSGLVVADVTEQNQGVYFEAGYAMGLNIPVIWTCNEKEKNEIHFDIRQYNTILWEDEDDLHERLTKRIAAIMGLQEK
jgi:nucleoside 2-deoxyribosyltransferase